MKDQEFQATVQQLSLYIFPPGYVSQLQQSSEDQNESQQKNESSQFQNYITQPGQNPLPPSSTFKKIPPSSLSASQKNSSFPPPFISNLNPTEPIKCENWTPQEDKKLLEVVFQKNLTPNYAALYLKGRTPAACSRRFSRLKQDYTDDQWKKLTNKPKSLFKKNPKHWDLNQDSRLIEGIRKYGNKWAVIAQQVFNGERTPGAISDRFRILRRRCGYIEEQSSEEQQIQNSSKKNKSK